MTRTPSPDSLLALVERGAGNATVSRMIARQALPIPDAEREGQGTPVVAPHDPGDMSADLHALGGRQGGLAGAFGGKAEAEQTAAPAETTLLETEQTTAQPANVQKAPPPPVPQDLDIWSKEQPTTNATIAAWLLRGKEFGFLTFTSGAFYERQIREISRQATSVRVYTTLEGAEGTLRVDPNGQMGALLILQGLLRGHARRWIADPSKKKTVLEAGDLLRNLTNARVADAHAGPSADLYQGFDWNGSKGPAQVLQALGDLPQGNYRIGLPFQGEFFPPGKFLATRQEAAKRAAGPGGTPAPITEPSMIKFYTDLYTSVWNPTKPTRNGVGGYEDTKTGRHHGGVAELGSTTLRQGIADLATRGIRITAVFADNNNHIHITKD